MHPLLDPHRRLVIGHRGAAAAAPENTLPSFRRAVEAGADAVELDVRVSADGVPVVLHDPTLERTTDRQGEVAALRLEEIRAADAGARFTSDGASFPWAGRGVRVPTLAEVLEEFPDLPVLVEVKEARDAAGVRAALDRQGAAGRCLVGSFVARALDPFRGAYPVCASRGQVARLLARGTLGLAPGRVPYQALSVPERYKGMPVVTRGLVRAAGRVGCPVHVWTVDDPDRAAVLWALGVAGIITNDPARMSTDRT